MWGFTILSIMTFSIKGLYVTFSIKSLYVTFSIIDTELNNALPLC